MSYAYVSSAFDKEDADSAMRRMVGGDAHVPKCEGCNQKIVDQFITLPSGKKYHPQCAPDSGFCDRCSKPIVGRMVNALGKNYHATCWTCASCNSELGDNFVKLYNQPFCLRCEQTARQSGEIKVAGGHTTITRIAPSTNKREEEKPNFQNELFQNVQAGKETCKWCRKVIGGEAIRHKQAFYHRECFYCSICANPIGDDGYTEKDDLVYCKTCLASAGGDSSKKCAGCQNDLSGTYVNVAGKQYHQSCFVCSKCSSSLTTGYAVKDSKPVCSKCVGPASYSMSSVAFSGAERKAGISVDPRSGKVIRK